MTDALLDAQRACARQAAAHYENFPVASFLLPARLRRPVAAIYAFARSADDIADEGDWRRETRLALLDRYAANLDAIAAGTMLRADAPPLFLALADAIRGHGLPLAPFHDLLSAFRQDVDKARYAHRRELLDYCRRSANPIGRLLLHLVGRDSDANLRCADAVCSALQLLNFLQDIRVDYRKGRIYLPQDEMREHGVREDQIPAGRYDPAWRALIDHQLDEIESLLRQGRPLLDALHGRFGLEIRAIWCGGGRVLTKLRAQNRRGFIGGQRLHAGDWIRIALSSVRLSVR